MLTQVRKRWLLYELLLLLLLLGLLLLLIVNGEVMLGGVEVARAAGAACGVGQGQGRGVQGRNGRVFAAEESVGRQ